jgi:hypothetical protein
MYRKTIFISVVLFGLISSAVSSAQQTSTTFIIPDTGQNQCYDNNGTVIACPAEGEHLAGQDASYQTTQPAYQDNGDGTITDLVTGLMWQKTPGGKVTWDEAMADSLTLGGYTDWRVPTIKELYSLMNFSGVTSRDAASSTPYLDTTYFDFVYGDASERFIDAQYWSSTEYVSTTMGGDPTVFGVNFADGRIKGYPRQSPRGAMLNFVRYVRGTTSYGINDFVDNGDGTITDRASGLMWLQADSGSGLSWEEALNWCESLSFADYQDWRLPDAKELQALVDYTRSPDTTASAAIDPLFSVTAMTDANGQTNYPYFWSSTTHLDGMNPGDYAVYIAFGEALGYMEAPPDSGNYQLMDVHGAGAQRSDPKTGNPADFPAGHGPQGDVIGIYNYARCVRGGSSTSSPANQPASQGDHQPPQEAIDACNGLSEGTTCHVVTPQGPIQGTCLTVPTGEFACVPDQN